MCSPSCSKKMGALMPIGMLCLAVGLLLPRIIHPASTAGADFQHAATGFLLGLSIVFNLAGVWKGRQRSSD